MELSTAASLAHNLMIEHGVYPEYTFEWARGKRRLGSCKIAYNRRTGKTEKTISLSTHYVLLNNEESVRDTILHEIAHALVGPANQHNFLWRQACIKVGAKPERCAGEEIVSVKGRYLLFCRHCNQTFAHLHRRPKAEKYARSWHTDCGRISKGKIVIVDTLFEKLPIFQSKEIPIEEMFLPPNVLV